MLCCPCNASGGAEPSRSIDTIGRSQRQLNQIQPISDWTGINSIFHKFHLFFNAAHAGTFPRSALRPGLVSFWKLARTYKDSQMVFSNHSDKQPHKLHLRPIDALINSHLLSLSSVFVPPIILCYTLATGLNIIEIKGSKVRAMQIHRLRQSKCSS